MISCKALFTPQLSPQIYSAATRKNPDFVNKTIHSSVDEHGYRYLMKYFF